MSTEEDMTQPRTALGVSLHLTVEGQEYIDRESQEEWNKRNLLEYAMVATAKRASLTREEWLHGTSVYRERARIFMLAELEQLKIDLAGATTGKIIRVTGVGKADDCGFVRPALESEFNVHFADHSIVALGNAQVIFGEIPGRLAYELADLAYVYRELIRSRDVWQHHGRIWHHLSVRKQKIIPRLFADFLSYAPEVRRITVIHPNLRDNQQWVGVYKSVKRVFNLEDKLPDITKAAGGPRSGLEAWIPRQSEPFEALGEKFTAATIMLRRV